MPDRANPPPTQLQPTPDTTHAVVGELYGRVNTLEHDLDSLTKTVERVIQTTETGFENTRALITESHKSVQADIHALSRTLDKRSEPRYGLWSIALSAVVLVSGWYVSSQIRPLEESLKAEREARMAADERSQTERDKNQDAISALHAAVISDTPEGKRAFMEEQTRMHERLATLEAWNEARKWFAEHPQTSAPR